jgi:hypothetical protein
MSKIRRHWNSTLLLGAMLVLALALFSACSAGSSGSDGSMEEGSEMEEMEHEEGEHVEEGEHEHTEERIHNDGAAIRILAPADGSTFAEGEEIVVEVEVENFALGEDGSHWHIYVDGASWGMVTGGDTDQALRGVELGEHLIETYLAGGDHIELEDGDTITIVVE